MAFSVELLLANEDILERSARLGVAVAHSPSASDLYLACEYFDDLDTVSVGRRMYIDVDHETGKIAACTVFDYEDVLFAEVPLLREYLSRHAQANSAQQRREWGIRIFQALLAVASPFFATKIVAAHAPRSVEVHGPSAEKVDWFRSGLRNITDLFAREVDSTGLGAVKPLAGGPLLAAFARDFQGASITLQPAGAWLGNLSITSGGDSEDIGQELELLGNDREITLRLVEDGDMLVIEGLRGRRGRLLESFRVALRRGNETLWSETSQDGRVELALDDLRRGLASGVDTLAIEMLEH